MSRRETRTPQRKESPATSPATPADTAVYLYCLVRSPRAPAVAGAPPGLPGLTAPRALGLGDGLWLIVADAPLPEYGEAAIQRHLQDIAWVSESALAHEAVVEHFVGTPALVPMKLFTLFSSAERARRHVASTREQVERVLARVAGCVEWGVQARFDEARARRAAADGGDGQEPGGEGRGRAFLLRKKRQQDATRALAGGLAAEVDAAFAELAASAVAACRREPVATGAGVRLLLDAAFLVPAAAATAFESAVARAAERLAHACEVTLTGPWPPYHFIDLDAAEAAR
jgi:gas vesicle protein GvpL/GvpF